MRPSTVFVTCLLALIALMAVCETQGKRSLLQRDHHHNDWDHDHGGRRNWDGGHGGRGWDNRNHNDHDRHQGGWNGDQHHHNGPDNGWDEHNHGFNSNQWEQHNHGPSNHQWDNRGDQHNHGPAGTPNQPGPQPQNPAQNHQQNPNPSADNHAGHSHGQTQGPQQPSGQNAQPQQPQHTQSPAGPNPTGQQHGGSAGHQPGSSTGGSTGGNWQQHQPGNMNGGRGLLQAPQPLFFSLEVPPAGLTESEAADWKANKDHEAYLKTITPNAPTPDWLERRDDPHADIGKPKTVTDFKLVRRLLKAAPLDSASPLAPGSASSQIGGNDNNRRALLQEDFGWERHRPLTEIEQMDRDGKFRGKFALTDPRKFDVPKAPKRKLLRALLG